MLLRHGSVAVMVKVEADRGDGSESWNVIDPPACTTATVAGSIGEMARARTNFPRPRPEFTCRTYCPQGVDGPPGVRVAEHVERSMAAATRTGSMTRVYAQPMVNPRMTSSDALSIVFIGGPA